MAGKKTSKSEADPKADAAAENLSDVKPESIADERERVELESAENSDQDGKSGLSEGVNESLDDSTADTPESEAEIEPAEASADADSTETDLEKESAVQAAEPEIQSTETPPVPEGGTPPATTVVERKGGLLPVVLGGVIAAALGFAAAQTGLVQTGDNTLSEIEARITDKLATTQDQLSSLSNEVADFPPPADLGAIEAMQAENSEAIAAMAVRLDAVSTQFDALDVRLTELEKRPMTEGASDAAIAAYERELQALQDAMAAQRAEIEAMASEALAMEENAEATAKETMQRAAQTRILTALDTGTGFAAAIADLKATGVTVPPVLSEVAESGPLSLVALQSEFPAAARAALAAARRDAAEQGEGGGLSAFLKTQLGARSLEPREGNDPDAVLSRAEDAVRQGRLNDALAEIEALPEAGQAEIADWAAKVTQRLEAVTAAEMLGQELN